MRIKTVLFFFLTFCCIVSLIVGKLWIITVLSKKFLKIGKKLKHEEIYTRKIKKILRTANLGSNFTGSYKRECTSTGRRKPLQCNQGSTLSFW